MIDLRLQCIFTSPNSVIIFLIQRCYSHVISSIAYHQLCTNKKTEHNIGVPNGAKMIDLVLLLF